MPLGLRLNDTHARCLIHSPTCGYFTIALLPCSLFGLVSVFLVFVYYLVFRFGVWLRKDTISTSHYYCALRPINFPLCGWFVLCFWTPFTTHAIAFTACHLQDTFHALHFRIQAFPTLPPTNNIIPLTTILLKTCSHTFSKVPLQVLHTTSSSPSPYTFISPSHTYTSTTNFFFCLYTHTHTFCVLFLFVFVFVWLVGGCLVGWVGLGLVWDGWDRYYCA